MRKRKDERNRGGKRPACTALNGVAAVCLVLSLLCGFVLPGVRFSGVLFFCLAVLSGVLSQMERMAEEPRWNVLRRIVWCGLSVGLAVFLVVEGMIISHGETEPEEPVDVIIVLGAGVNGTVPSLTLQTRICAARDYMERYPEVIAVLSGGQGPGEEITEAQAMFRALTDAGIGENRLLLEERSTSTAENLAFSREILRENGFADDARMGIVTNDFHQFRAQWIAKDAGISAVGIPAELPWWWLNANYYVREFFALGKLWLTGLTA